MGEVSYRLHLPAQLRCHNVFHVSLLRKFYPNASFTPPPLPELIEGDLEYEVEKIIDHKTEGKGHHKKQLYLIRWKGYTSDYDTWQEESTLSHAPLLIQEFWDRHNSGRPTT